MALFRAARAAARAGRTLLIPGGLTGTAAARRFVLSTAPRRSDAPDLTDPAGQTPAVSDPKNTCPTPHIR